MQTINEPEIFRANIVAKIQVILGDEDGIASRNLEKGIFNFAIRDAISRKVVKKWDNSFFVIIYTDRLRSVLCNLDNDEKLVYAIACGAIDPKAFANMTHQEMNPERWETLIQQKIKRDFTKYETSVEASTDTFTCRKCKSKRCNYYQMQTRSADEPMTTFVSCIECGTRWKC